jgi:hypothetical protein
MVALLPGPREGDSFPPPNGVYALLDPTVEEKLLQLMLDIGPTDVMHGFDQFENSDHIKAGDVRTKGPFLFGILSAIYKKNKGIQTRPAGEVSWPSHLLPSVRNCFIQLVLDTGMMRTTEVEPKTLVSLAEMYEPDAIAVLEEFSTLDRSKLKNPNAYLFGMIRKTISRLVESYFILVPLFCSMKFFENPNP